MKALPILPFVLGLLLFWTPSSAGAQSLAEVARREEDRRKSIDRPARVYTNEDLRGNNRLAPPQPSQPQAAGAAAAAAEPPPAEPAAPDQADEPDEPARDEAWWRTRITQAHTAVDRTQTYLDALQSRINALTTDFVNRDDPFQRAQIEADRLKAIAELERLQIEVEQQRQAIVDIHEEARRSGVPPGWLR